MSDNFFKNRNGIALGSLSAAPSNPKNGDFYYDTTLNKFRRYENGAWGSFGSGSGGSGKNYLTAYTASPSSGVPNSGNGDLEGGSTSGFSLGAVTLTSNFPTGVPTFGSGASGNLSLSVIGSGSQIGGNYSLGYVSSAVTTAGNFVATDAFYIDAEDQGKVLSFSFVYKAAVNPSNGDFSGTSSNSFAVAIYDVTNSAWIQPAGLYNIIQNSGCGLATGTFQVPINTTRLRLVVYNANASAGAITMYFDDFSVGPQMIQKGPAMTDWQTYSLTIGAVTTVPTPGTNTSTAYWRRVGDSIEINYAFSQTTAGSSGSGNYLFPLPPGLSIDTTKVKVSTTAIGSGGHVVGNGQISSTASANTSTAYTGVNVIPYDSKNLQLVSDISTPGQTSPIGSGFFGLAQAITNISFTAKVPVVGWSSNSSMSSDTDTRVVDFNGITTATQALTGGTTNMSFTATKDTHGAWNGSVYTVPVSGDYFVAASSSDSGSNTIRWDVYVNGALFMKLFTGVSGNIGSGGILVPNLAAGATISLRIATSTTVSSDSSLSIFRLSGPAVVAATETVAANAFLASQSFTAATTTLLQLQKTLDTHGAWNNSTYTFTAPVSGTYKVSACFTSGPFTTGGAQISLLLYKNGSSYGTVYTGSNAAGVGLALDRIMQLNAGDTLSLYANTGTGNSNGVGNINLAINRISN